MHPTTHAPTRILAALTASAAGLLLVPAASLAAPASAPTARVLTPTTAAARPTAHVGTYLHDCTGETIARPRTFVLACGDGNSTLRKLQWRAWGTEKARATGVVESNDCEPDCATGKLRRYTVRVTADRRANGEAARFYRRLTVTFTGERPAGASRVERYAAGRAR